MLDKLLLPIDLTESSEIGFKTVESLSKKLNPELFLLYVLEPIKDIPFDIFEEEIQHLHDLKYKLKEEAEKTLSRYVEILISENIKSSYSIVEGDEVESILDFTQKNKIDLIVIPAHKKTKVEYKALGSVSLRVASKATSSVLVVKQKPVLDIKNILVNYDFLPSSIKALEKAVYLAKNFGSSIKVIHVDNDEHYTHFKSVYQKVIEKKLKLLEEIKERYKNIDISTTLIKGNPKEEILKEIHSNGYDLVVMGKRNPVNKSRIFIGSLALEILRESPISVLISRGEYEE
ncbi:MAG: universal stress protein [Hydrogenothermaceae bacterium]|nr:universal stress protein [Hydrogenothermaceae bacterium]